MVASMTGYGTGVSQSEETQVLVECRTGNHRFLDIHIRIAREYLCFEPELIGVVKKRISRGRVDLTVTVRTPASPELLISTSVAKAYRDAAEMLGKELSMNGSLDIGVILGLPGVLQNRDALLLQRKSGSDLINKMIVETSETALEQVVNMRSNEGEKLASDMKQYVELIENSCSEIVSFAPGMVDEYRSKLNERLSRLSQEASLDTGRIEQEIALMAEKSDITEELTRLSSHTSQFMEVMSKRGEVGKKLDFLLQEMNREVNTILAKSHDLEITRSGITVRANVEKLREQVQNLE